MNLFDPDPSLRWLFCFTHPDDEIAICAWMRTLVLAGAEVHACWSHSTPVREAEARAGMAKVGVPGEHLRFFGARDQGVVDEIDRLVPLYTQLGVEASPDRVVVGAFEQGHIDHDATNLIVSLALPEATTIEFPLYHPYTTRMPTINEFTDPKGQEQFELSPELQRFKLDFAKTFPSQNIWRLLVLNELRGMLMFRRAGLLRRERLRRQTHFDFLSPNLPQGMSIRVQKSAIWKRWLAAVEPHLK